MWRNMAELLGNKFCVESLHKDVGDLHSVLGNVTSRLGLINYTSWKYPDKAAIDVDIPELLEMCEFDGSYEEENKISHLLLLELVIDRLLFFIQSSNRFMDQMFVGARAQSAVDSHNSSIGNVTKKYWSKMLQLHSNNQQMQSDAKSHIRKIKELQSFNQQMEDELSQYHQGVTMVPASAPSHKFTNGSILPPISPAHGEATIAKDNSNKSSQTLETAFVPCESCHRVQNSFKSVADSMTNLCKTQGLPSSVAKYRKQLKGIEWCSANDLNRWSVEQNKDLDRINKHLEDLMNTIDPLKEELSGTITSCRKLEKRVAECQRDVELEKETQRVLERQHVHKVDTITKSHEDVRSELETQRNQLQKNREQLETRLKDTECELELQKSKYQELDDVKKQLMVEFEESKTNNSEVKRLESILSSLEQEMSRTKELLLETETQLSQEQAITKSLTKRTESLQSKYDSLVRRLDEMDDENNNLQSELSSLIEEKEQLEASLAEATDNKPDQSIVQKIEGEKARLKIKMSSLEGTVEKLEQDVASMKERERLMVEYPDLNGPVNADVAGTGDIVEDMSNQVKANEMRIDLLQKQTTTMKKTLNKLTLKRAPASNDRPPSGKPPSYREEDSPSHYKSVEPMKPTALWNQTESHSSQVQSADSERGDFTVGRAPDQPDRPRRTHTAQPNSGMDAYMKLKKAGLLSKTDGSSSKQSRHERAPEAAGSKSYCCPNCDKLYHSLADLEIHRSYCARR